MYFAESLLGIVLRRGNDIGIARPGGPDVTIGIYGNDIRIRAVPAYDHFRSFR